MKRFSSQDGMYEDSTDGDYVLYEDHVLALMAQDKLLAERGAALTACYKRIAELEKQAAIDKTLLALADARINRELRDDFAGRAMQGLLAQPGMTVDIDGEYLGQKRAGLAYGLADAMLKAKGGA